MIVGLVCNVIFIRISATGSKIAEASLNRSNWRSKYSCQVSWLLSHFWNVLHLFGLLVFGLTDIASHLVAVVAKLRSSRLTIILHFLREICWISANEGVVTHNRSILTEGDTLKNEGGRGNLTITYAGTRSLVASFAFVSAHSLLIAATLTDARSYLWVRVVLALPLCTQEILLPCSLAYPAG